MSVKSRFSTSAQSGFKILGNSLKTFRCRNCYLKYWSLNHYNTLKQVNL